MDFDFRILVTLSIATALGALIGAERERAQNKEKSVLFDFSGLRTYTIIGIIGWLGAFLSYYWGPILLVAVFASVVIFLLASYLNESKLLKSSGVTSEMSAIVTFLVGVVAFSEPLVAAVVAVGVVMILALKKNLHRFVHTLSHQEFFATLKFIAVAGVALPLLPREAIDPWGVIVPFEAWLMVVFVSAISFTGYILTKLIGPRQGIRVTGIIGGLASSTATTTSMSQQSKQNRKVVLPFAFAVIAASGMMFLRVGLEIFVVNSDLLPQLCLMLGSMVVATVMMLGIFWKQSAKKESAIQSKDLKLSSPFQFGPALQFGIFYVVILLVSQFAQKYFGDSGVYLASAASGLADVDAITISLGNLAGKGEILAETAARGITIAVLVNTLVKLVIVRIFGGKAFFRKALPAFGVVLAAGIASVLIF